MTEYRHIASIFIHPVFSKGGVKLLYIITCKRLLLHLRVRRLSCRMPLLTFENRKSYIMKKETYATPEASEFYVNLESAMLTTSQTDFSIEIDDAVEDSWDVTEL